MGMRRVPFAVWLSVPFVLACAGIALVAHTRRSAEPPRPAEPSAAGETCGPDCDLCMEQGQRESLWDIEHHGNVLVKFGFRSLSDALGRADRPAVATMLHDGFTGEVPRQSREVRLTSPAVQVVREEGADSPRQTLRAEEWLARLFAYRDQFRQPPRVQVSLMTLAPAEPDRPEGLWQGTAVLRLAGEVEPGRPAEVTLHLQYRLPEPTEPLFEQPGWLRSCAVTQALVGKSTHPLFRDVTADSGIDPKPLHDNWYQRQKLPNTGGVYVCDFNRDGILDILLTDVNGVFLYQGLPGGKFRDVTAQVGLPAGRALPGTLAAFADLDGDGWEDLILADRVYRNDGGQRFVDVTSRTNLRIPEDVNGIVVADYDRDGRLDLYLTHVARQGKACSTSYLDGHSGDTDGNQLWRNRGNWQFEDVTAKSGADGGRRSAFTAVWFDANDDGWPDLYVPNEFGNGVLLINQRDGTFREAALTAGPCDFGTMGATCGDIDNDGRIDLYAANMYSKAGSRVIGNVKPGTYPEDIMTRMRRFVAGSQLHRNLGIRNEELGIREKGSTGHPSPASDPSFSSLNPNSSPLAPSFEQLGQAWQVAAVGWAYGPVLADLDNDGWLDLYAPCGFLSNSRTDPDG